MRHTGRAAWRHRLRHSLRLRLIAVFVLLALAMTAVFVGGMQRAFSAGWKEAAQPVARDYIDRLAAEIGSPPDVERARALSARLPISVRIDGPAVHWRSHVQEADDDGARANPWRGRRGDWLQRTTADGHRITFGLGTVPWQRGPHGIGWATLALLLALTLAAYAYLRRLLRPLDDIRAGAERVGRGDFTDPIPVRRRDQLGELAARINTMARDIGGMLDAKRGLLLALSHELRSPLTRARLNAELLPTTGEGAGERAALLRDIDTMRDLIADLLESERLASPHAALHREPVDLPALLREVLQGLPGSAAVVVDVAAGLARTWSLDRARVRLALRNLVDNALRHSAGAALPPGIALQADGAGVRLTVRDHGPGVDDAQLARLTEPFYRTDSARQRATGGIGLGLYLCRLVAEAHGGQLVLRNAMPGMQVDLLLNE